MVHVILIVQLPCEMMQGSGDIETKNNVLTFGPNYTSRPVLPQPNGRSVISQLRRLTAIGNYRSQKAGSLTQACICPALVELPNG